MAQSPSDEEVNFTPIIRDLERIFSRTMKFISSILSFLFNKLIQIAQFSFKNKKLIFIGLILGAGLGYLSFYILPQNYKSSMLVRFYINAKDQLHSDIHFFDALCEDKQYSKLADLLEISEEEAAHITGFSILPKFNYLEHLKLADQNYRNLDSTTRRYIPLPKVIADGYSEFINTYEISIYATKQNIFEKIENPLINYLERIEKLQVTRQRILESMQKNKEILANEMIKLDTLKHVMNQSMLVSAKTEKSNQVISLVTADEKSQSSNFNPLSVYMFYMDYFNKMAYIDQQIENYRNCYVIESRLSPFGSPSIFGYKIRMLIGAISLCVILMIFRLLSGLKNSI